MVSKAIGKQKGAEIGAASNLPYRLVRKTTRYTGGFLLIKSTYFINYIYKYNFYIFDLFILF